MESRKITIVNTSTQRKSIFMSEAETLGQLKADLDKQGVDYTNKKFYEGTSRTTMTDDDSMLPKEVIYKGDVTNELVFMLTTVDKKIESGMTRSEVYNAIKKEGLQEVVKAKFGKNFTQCSTQDLIDVLNDTPKATKVTSKKVTKTVKEEVVTEKAPSVITEDPQTCESGKAVLKLVTTLFNKGILNQAEVLSITEELPEGCSSSLDLEESITSSYSDSDINDMISAARKNVR